MKKVCFLDFISYAVDLINKYGIGITDEEVRKRYSEPHRHFHTVEHLNDVLKQIIVNRQYLPLEDFVSLIIAGVFHDIVYEPTRQDNEERSADFFMSLCENKSNKDILDIRDAILDTKTHKSSTPLASYCF